MKKSHVLIALMIQTVFASNSYALEQLYDHDLQSVDGQAGADLSLYLGLNHRPISAAAPDTDLLAAYDPARTPQFDIGAGIDQFACSATALEYCRMAIALNNRTANAAGQPLGNNTGRKQWVVLKGIQGTINIQKLGLDGVDVDYMTFKKPAIKLTFDPKIPIQIRNFGFHSMSLETDTALNEGSGNTPGYLRTEKYTATSGAFDANNPFTGTAREKGFLGVNANMNLAINGTLKIFSCANAGVSAPHPRC